MTYRTLMVQLDRHGHNDARLKIARELADRFTANVIGVAAAELSPTLYFVEGAQAARLIEEGRNRLREKLVQLEVQFRAAMKGIKADFEWRSAIDFADDFLVGQVGAADLVISGQMRTEEEAGPWEKFDIGQFLMAAGRPLLTVPNKADWLDLRTVLVAWKESREARRAISDALPLLSVAKEVIVAEILENDIDRASALARIKDVAAWLKRHNVHAATHAIQGSGSVAHQIDRMAAERGATLIVAGGYGRSRLSEWAFGGVTRHLLHGSPHCALLSH